MDRFRDQLVLVSAAGADAVLIGGIAVGLHTEPRATFDVDFVIRVSDLSRWKKVLHGAGWNLLCEREAFVQWLRPTDEARMDLMLVDDRTFQKIWEESEARVVAGVDLRVASAKTLLAMKLHSTHYRKSDKLKTDWSDVIALMTTCGYTVDSIEFKKLFSRYAAPLSYEQFCRRDFGSESAGASS
jgi:hypothetical protein